MDLYYFDESGFSQKSNLPYAWSPVGEPFAFPAYSHSKRLNVLGFLSRQGKLVYHSTEGHVTTDTVIEAFEKLIENKPHTAKKKLTVVFLDNASFHRSAKFKEKCSDWITEGVLVLYLPAYSPELNIIEILWRKIKYEWLPTCAFETFENLTKCVKNILSNYSSKFRITFT